MGLVRVRVKGSATDHLVDAIESATTLCGRLLWRPIIAPRTRKPRVCGMCGNIARYRGEVVPR